jgi:hypothetical protein
MPCAVNYQSKNENVSLKIMKDKLTCAVKNENFSQQKYMSKLRGKSEDQVEAELIKFTFVLHRLPLLQILCC